MIKGTLEFRASIPGFKFSPFEVKTGDTQIPNVEFSSIQSIDAVKNELKAIAFVADMPSQEEARQKATARLSKMLDTIAFHLSSPIGEIRLERDDLKKYDSAGNVVIEGHATGVAMLSMTGCAVVYEVPPQQISSLRIDLESANRPGEKYYPLFRSALKLEDIVGRFFYLYSILLLIEGDSQKNVDIFIRNQRPNVSQSPRPKSKNTMETVYTRLRNEVGHVRANATFENTKAEMAQHVGDLADLVKIAIKLSL